MKKLLQARGKQVEVEDFDVKGSNGEPAKKLIAIIGTVVVEKVHTFGADNGPRPALTLSQLQSDLDLDRQQLAEEAAWRDEIATLLSQVS